MTTTTATSTPTATTRPTGASAVQAATKTLLTSLGTGSGVDTAALVDSLVEAQFAARAAQLTARSDKLTAQISGVSTIKSTISGFSTALDTLARGGTLRTQPRSGDPGVLAATANGLGMNAALAATVRVDRLASAQASASPPIAVAGAPAGRTTAIGSGTFTLSLGAATYETGGDGTTRMKTFEGATGAGTSIAFSLEDASITSIAAAINKEGKALGISATVVTGAKGEAFLSIKGPSGTAGGFTLTTTGDAALKPLEIVAGSAVTAKAENAQIVVDGVAVERASNTVGDLFTGVKLELTGLGTSQLSTARPTEALTQAVEDVVATYNEVLKTITAETNAKTGKLYGDPAAEALLRRLKALTLTPLAPAAAEGAPRTLADLGVRTQRDGTLSVDAARLARVIADQPDGVEAMFRATTLSSTGLPAQLQTIAADATSAKAGLGASTQRYGKAQDAIALAQEKLTREGEAMTTRLTSQFSAMNARVSAYKATQTFLTNQIAAWNRSDG